MLAMKHKNTTGLRALAIGTVTSIFAIMSVVAVPTSANAAGKNVAVAADKLNWAPWGKGPAQIVVLWGDPKSGEYAALLKLPPGFTPGPHAHSEAYHGVNLQGTWVHIFGNDDVRSLPAGSYVMQPGKAFHNDACAGPDECILFIHQHGPSDFIPPKGSDQ